MYVLDNLVATLIFLLSFTVVYFVVEKLLITKNILRFNLALNLQAFLFGLIMGGLITLGEYILKVVDNNNYLFLIFIALLLLSFFKAWQVSLYAFIAPLIYLLLVNKVTDLLYFQVIVVFIMLLGNHLGQQLLAKPWRILGLLILILLFIIIALPLDLLYFSDLSLSYNLQGTVWTYFWALIAFFIFLYFINFSLSSQLLFQSSHYAFLNYYHSGLAHQEMMNYIREAKVETGILGLFQIQLAKAALNAEQKREVIETALEKIAAQLEPKQAVLFFAPDNNYGFFHKSALPVTKMQADLALLLKQIPRQYSTSWGEVETIKLKMGISVYGLHDDSLITLNQYALFALTTIFLKQEVNFFNAKTYTKFIREFRQLKLMDQAITLDDYQNSFYELWKIDDRQATFFGIRVITANISEFAWHESVETRIYFKKWSQLFTRYFALDALQTLFDTKILIDYDFSVFLDHFDVQDFLDQVTRQKISPQNLFLVLKKASIIQIKNYAKLKKIINKLSKAGVNFVIDTKISTTIMKRAFPEIKYLLGTSGNPAFPHAILIDDHFNDPQYIQVAQAQNVNVLGGTMTKNNFKNQKVNKQSKIMIEELLSKGVNYGQS